MRVLFVSPVMPVFHGSGAAVRIFHLMHAVAREYETHLLTLVSASKPHAPSKPLSTICGHIETVPIDLSRRYWHLHLRYLFSRVPYYRNVTLSEALVSNLKMMLNRYDYDIVQIELLTLAHLVDFISGKTVLDMHNVEFLLYARQYRILPFGIEKLIGWTDVLKLKSYERCQINRFDVCLAVSDQDKKVLQNKSRRPVVPVVNGVDTQFFIPSQMNVRPCSMVFIGSFSYYPNVDAMLYFCREILPLIRRKNAKAHLTIVGHSPPAKLRRLGRSDFIDVTGRVVDVRPYLAQAEIVVVPLRSGSGTRLKILEAWSMAKAVVSTQIGAEGLAAEHGRNILIADRTSIFAECIFTLFDNQQLRQDVGFAARNTAIRNYTWKHAGSRLLKVYRELLGH